MLSTNDCGKATSKMTAEAMAMTSSAVPRQAPWPHELGQSWDNVRDAHLLLIDEAIAAIPPYPEERFKGRGIVVGVNAKPGMSSGKNLDHGYFPGAWVLVQELRRQGCTLPITFAHLGAYDRFGDCYTSHGL